MHPDLVLMDVRMPDLDGIAATRRLLAAAPEVKVIILTTFEQDDYIFGAIEAGASGFLLKRARPEELLSAIHAVAAGDSLLSPSVTRIVLEHLARQPTSTPQSTSQLAELTPRELQVLELIACGHSNREIGATLVIEESTVKTHIKRILLKLDLRDRIHAVIFAYETGLASPIRDPRSKGSSPVSATAGSGLDRYPTLPLTTRAYGLRAKLTAYDATYVALAEGLGCELLTGHAARGRAGSALLDPAAAMTVSCPPRRAAARREGAYGVHQFVSWRPPASLSWPTNTRICRYFVDTTGHGGTKRSGSHPGGREFESR